MDADKKAIVIPEVELDTSEGKPLVDTLGKSLGLLSVGVPGCHLAILGELHLRLDILCSVVSANGGKPKAIETIGSDLQEHSM